LEKDYGLKEKHAVKLVGHPGAGLSGGFYKDFMHYKDSKKGQYITMHQASKVIRILDMIKESSIEGKTVQFK